MSFRKILRWDFVKVCCRQLPANLNWSFSLKLWISILTGLSSVGSLVTGKAHNLPAVKAPGPQVSWAALRSSNTLTIFFTHLMFFTNANGYFEVHIPMIQRVNLSNSMFSIVQCDDDASFEGQNHYWSRHCQSPLPSFDTLFHLFAVEPFEWLSTQLYTITPTCHSLIWKPHTHPSRNDRDRRTGRKWYRVQEPAKSWWGKPDDWWEEWGGWDGPTAKLSPPVIIEQSAIFFAWPFLPFMQPFSKPVSSFGTLKVFTTHMPSNPAFFQVMKSVSVSVHNQPGQFNQTPMFCNVQHDDDAFCKEHNQSASEKPDAREMRNVRRARWIDAWTPKQTHTHTQP